MSTKIYTRTGDKGTTALIGGTRVSKSHERIEAYGTVDELNSHIGLCCDLLSDAATRKTLQEIQDRLFTIGSSLACDPEKEPKLRIPDLSESDVIFLESEIDRMNAALPEMKNFILPGGHPTVSQLHIARCVCRRAERRVIALGELVPALVVKYLNRLSDHLFVLARYTGSLLNAPEIPWKPRLGGA
ncbi:MAG TPA: cob(I)yrinic acid a,c-diamide adenosyltransferase [Chitinophagaceae bacterium]|nr:cob(I)yrinic acid a,c-diamide adenosyltransferase [Chitinophagaceae bacterium]